MVQELVLMAGKTEEQYNVIQNYWNDTVYCSLAMWVSVWRSYAIALLWFYDFFFIAFQLSMSFFVVVVVFMCG